MLLILTAAEKNEDKLFNKIVNLLLKIILDAHYH